jgi:teichuronic acid biosynthesis glycosyltransferase TuaC
MKIAVITPHFPTEAEPHRGAPVWNSIKALARIAELHVYCTSPRYLMGPRPAWLATGHIKTGGLFHAELVEYAALPTVSRALNGMSMYRELRRAICSCPDVLLAYWVYPDGYAAVRVGNHLRIPAVVFARGSDLKLNAHFPLTRHAHRYAVKQAAAVIGVSEDLTNAALSLGASPTSAYTVVNGVNTADFHFAEQSAARAQLHLPPNDRIVLYVGRLAPKKGLPQLIESIGIARRRNPALQLVIIGNGGLEAELRSHASIVAPDAVHFTGPLEHRQLAPWINAADLLCLASESEGCPNVILEALSCGRAVVATGVGGVPEILGETCGILIPDNAAETIANAIDRALTRTWNREHIAKTWNRGWDRVARETLAICHAARHGRTAHAAVAVA